MQRLYRLLDDLRQARRQLRGEELRVGGALLLLLVAFLALVSVFYPDVVVQLVLDGVFSLLVTVIAVFVSLDVLLKATRRAEHGRLMPPDDVRETYPELDYLRVDDVPGWEAVADRCPPAVPFVTEYVSDEPHSVREFEVDVSDEVSELPRELELLLEPAADRQRARFREEGHFNQLVGSLREIDGRELSVDRITYYQAFRTAMSADYELFGGKTLRDVSRQWVVDDGDVVPLPESPFSGTFGGGGIVVTADGRTALPVRSTGVAFAGKSREVSFGGSFQLDRLTREDGLYENFLAELDEELGVPAERVRDVACLGIVRRLDLLGSPDTLVVAVLDEDATFDNASDENLRVTERRLLPEGDRVESVDDLFEPERATHLCESLFGTLGDDPYPPGPALRAAVALVAAHAGVTDAE